MAIQWRRNLTIDKDPDAVLDYDLDCTSWLNGDTLSSPTVTAESGLTVDSYSNTSAVITVWLSGGTAGQVYDVTYHIVTSGGREDDRTVRIRIREY